jgi:hypothetical protein
VIVKVTLSLPAGAAVCGEEGISIGAPTEGAAGCGRKRSST